MISETRKKQQAEVIKKRIEIKENLLIDTDCDKGYTKLIKQQIRDLYKLLKRSESGEKMRVDYIWVK